MSKQPAKTAARPPLRLIVCEGRRVKEQKTAAAAGKQPLFSNAQRDTISVFKCLANAAIDGEVRSVVVWVKGKDGREEMYCTGDYKTDPAQVISAAMRMASRMANRLDEE